MLGKEALEESISMIEKTALKIHPIIIEIQKKMVNEV